MKITKAMEADLQKVSDVYEGRPINVGDFIFSPQEDWEYLREIRDEPPGDNDFVVDWVVMRWLECDGYSHKLVLDPGCFKVRIEYENYQIAGTEVVYEGDEFYADTDDNFLRESFRLLLEKFDDGIFAGKVSP